MSELISKNPDKKPHNIAVELTNWALEKGSTDNVSVIVIEIIH